MTISDVIVLGVGPGSDVKTFLTFGLDIGAAVALYYEGNTAAVAWRDKRLLAEWRDKRQSVKWRDKRVWVDAT